MSFQIEAIEPIHNPAKLKNKIQAVLPPKMELRGFGDQIIFKELPGLINRKRAYDQ